MLRPFRRLSCPRAFTLIELLVVIAVVAILAAVMVTGIGSSRARAEKAKCVANQHSLLLGAHLYAGENGGLLPRPFDIVAGVHPGQPDYYRGLITLLDPYMEGSKEVYYCPDAMHSRSDGGLAYTYDYQSARGDGKRFNQIGYYWAAASGGGWNPPENLSVEGSAKRILVTCVTHNGYRDVHSGSVTMGFVDGSVRSFEKTMNSDIDVNTLEFR